MGERISSKFRRGKEGGSEGGRLQGRKASRDGGTVGKDCRNDRGYFPEGGNEGGK